MYIATTRLDNRSLHLELRRGEQESSSTLSVEAPEFLSTSALDMKTKEFVPREESVTEILNEFNKKLEEEEKVRLELKAKSNNELEEELKEKEKELEQLMATCFSVNAKGNCQETCGGLGGEGDGAEALYCPLLGRGLNVFTCH